MSNRGVVFKTHEGQLHTGGVTAGAEGELASTIWDFSVKRENEVVLNSISKAADEQKRVKLFYDEKFHQWKHHQEIHISLIMKILCSSLNGLVLINPIPF